MTGYSTDKAEQQRLMSEQLSSALAVNPFICGLPTGRMDPSLVAGPAGQGRQPIRQGYPDSMQGILRDCILLAFDSALKALVQNQGLLPRSCFCVSSIPDMASSRRDGAR